MNLICYVPKNFSTRNREVIDHANEIIEEYAGEGYDLTLRQLYYQFVSRDLLANTLKSYNRLGSIVNDARLAGLIDWDSIVDRTRRLSSLAHWDTPAEIVDSCARQFRVDRWANQPCRPEVWIEKEALAGVFQRVCEKFDVPLFPCRGYVSQSAMWRAAQRLAQYADRGQTPMIFHFGDHDPSGIDMTRDNLDRLQLFSHRMHVKRVALNQAQVEEYNPPPNPAKVTDSRFASYAARFGYESWELDALEPKVLVGLVRENLETIIDDAAWKKSEKLQAAGRKKLRAVAKELSND